MHGITAFGVKIWGKRGRTRKASGNPVLEPRAPREENVCWLGAKKNTQITEEKSYHQGSEEERKEKEDKLVRRRDDTGVFKALCGVGSSWRRATKECGGW